MLTIYAQIFVGGLEDSKGPSLIGFAAVAALQVLCFRNLRCNACGVDPGEPRAPRTAKTTTQDCVMLSPANQVYQDPQSSQVPLMWT